MSIVRKRRAVFVVAWMVLGGCKKSAPPATDSADSAIAQNPADASAGLRAPTGEARVDTSTWKREYEGSLGAHFVRMKLEKKGTKLTGVYRYEKSPRDISLEGTMNGEAFTLTEHVGANVTGSFKGRISDAGLQGEWLNPDASTRWPVAMKVPDGSHSKVIADIGAGLSIYPVETNLKGKRCSAHFVVPQLRGASDKAKEASLNAALRKAVLGDHGKSCEGPSEPDVADSEESVSYEVLSSDPGHFVNLALLGSSYQGGAHGIEWERCIVVDTVALESSPLVALLTESGRKKLGEMTAASFVRARGIAKLTEGGFFEDTVDISNETSVCLDANELHVSFGAGQLAPYDDGPPSTTFPKRDVRALFVKTALTDAMFGP